MKMKDSEIFIKVNPTTKVKTTPGIHPSAK